MATVPSITIADGVDIPQLGFGTFQIDPDQTEARVREALEVGYRHLDTAQMYGNEAGVGAAVRSFDDADRDEIFVTSKLDNGAHARDDALRAFDETMERLGLDHLDLFLIHWPMPDADTDYVETWRTMEEIRDSGRARSIGVSNFQPHHLRRLLDETDTVPAVNQIEVHPFLVQDEVRAFGRDHGIATEAWSPIAQGDVLGDATLERIGKEHDKTEAQVTLRWHLQRGDIVFPKSNDWGRMQENFDLFDFALPDEDMEAITALDQGARRGPDPDEFTSPG